MIIRRLQRWKTICWGLASLIIAMAVASCMSASSIENVVLCERTTSYQCTILTSEFTEASSDIMVNADISALPSNGIVEVAWAYLDGELGTARALNSSNFRKPDSFVTSMYAVLNRPERGWPVGTYEVTLSVQNDTTPPVTQTFSIFSSP